MSDLSIALITGGFTLGAVALTFTGTAVTDRLRSRRAARDAQDAAITELLAASADLVQAAAAIRIGWAHRTGWRQRLLIGAAVLPDFQPVRSWKDFTDHAIQRALLRTVTDLAREQDAAARALALDYAAVVIPRTNRFFAAAVTLTLGPDKQLADAARKLAAAGGQMMEAAGARPRKLARARGRFEKELGAFRTVADRRRR